MVFLTAVVVVLVVLFLTILNGRLIDLNSKLQDQMSAKRLDNYSLKSKVELLECRIEFLERELCSEEQLRQNQIKQLETENDRLLAELESQL